MAESLKMKAPDRIDQRMPGGKEARSHLPWVIKGELFLNCNCEVFCPCVISLGKAPPTQGSCKAWMAIAIDEGHYDGEDLTGINVGLLVDIPGRMGEGQWKAAVYVDDSASYKAFHGICQIIAGKCGGTTGVLSKLIGEVLGAERTPVKINREGRKRSIEVGKKIRGELEIVEGANADEPIVIKNTRYWMGPDITVARGTKSRLRDYGRVWDFDGKSGEICAIDWSGP